MGGADTNGGASLFEVGIPSEVHLPAARSHNKCEATIYGLHGTSTWTVERVPTVVGPGDVLCVPRGAIHRFDNDSGFYARVLIVATPGLIAAAFFRELGAVINNPGEYADAHAQVNSVLARHGFTGAP